MMRICLVAGLLLGATQGRLAFRKRQKIERGELEIPSSAHNRTTTEEDYWAQWEDFRTMTKKRYLTQSHHDERFEIFKDNIDKINRHNAKGHTWELGVTPFADLTNDEFSDQIVGYCKLKPRKNDKRVIDFGDTTNNPDEVDWTKQGKVTPVKNQGQCGSCWAFSTTGAVEGRYAIAKGTLNSLSEQELVDCAGPQGNNGCRGGLMDYGFEYVKKYNGLCAEDAFPYDAKTETRKCNQLRNACTHEDAITGYVDVKKNSEADLETAVAGGPVSIAIEADQSEFQLYKKGVFTGRCGTRLDHGVLAVGYSNTDAEGAYWKVKNSWGADWGENGYIRLCKDCGKNRGAGQCGLLGQPSYPTV